MKRYPTERDDKGSPAASRVRRAKALVLLATLGAGALSACGGGQAAQNSYVGVVRETPLHVESVALTDVTEDSERAGGIVEGGKLRMKAAPGSLLLMYFGFTNCPDVCPTTFADLKVGLKDLTAAERERVDVAFATIDPARDTADIMNRYMGHFYERFHVLRDEPANIEAAAKAFLASFTVTGTGAETEVAHTAVLYAVDENGAVRVEWPFGTAGKSIGADLKQLLVDLGGNNANG